MIELYIENQLVDQSDKIDYSIEKSFFDASDPSKLCDNFSKTIKIPMTDKNRKLFGHWEVVDRWTARTGEGQPELNTGIYFSPYLKLHFVLKDCGQTIMEGDARFIKCNYSNKDRNYEIQLNGNWNETMHKLSITPLLDLYNEVYVEQQQDELNALQNYINMVEEPDRYTNSLQKEVDGYIITLPNCTYYPNFESSKFLLDTVDEWSSDVDIPALTAQELRLDKASTLISVRVLFKVIERYLNGTLILDPQFFNDNNPYFRDTFLEVPSSNIGEMTPDPVGTIHWKPTVFYKQLSGGYSASQAITQLRIQPELEVLDSTGEVKAVEAEGNMSFYDTSNRYPAGVFERDETYQQKDVHQLQWFYDRTNEGHDIRSAYEISIQSNPGGTDNGVYKLSYRSTQNNYYLAGNGITFGEGTSIYMLNMRNTYSPDKTLQYRNFQRIPVEAHSTVSYTVQRWCPNGLGLCVQASSVGLGQNVYVVRAGTETSEVVPYWGGEIVAYPGDRIEIRNNTGTKQYYPIACMVYGNSERTADKFTPCPWLFWGDSTTDEEKGKYFFKLNGGTITCSIILSQVDSDTEGTYTKVLPITLREASTPSTGGVELIVPDMLPITYNDDAGYFYISNISGRTIGDLLAKQFPTMGTYHYTWARLVLNRTISNAQILYNTGSNFISLVADKDNIDSTYYEYSTGWADAMSQLDIYAQIVNQASGIRVPTILGQSFNILKFVTDYMKHFNLKLLTKDGYNIITTNNRLLQGGELNTGIKIDYSTIPIEPNILDSTFLTTTPVQSDNYYNQLFYKKYGYIYGASQQKLLVADQSFNTFALKENPVLESYSSAIDSSITVIPNTISQSSQDKKLYFVRAAQAATRYNNISSMDSAGDLLEDDSKLIFYDRLIRIPAAHPAISISSLEMENSGSYSYYHPNDSTGNYQRLTNGELPIIKLSAYKQDMNGKIITTNFKQPNVVYYSVETPQEDPIHSNLQTLGVRDLFHAYLDDFYSVETRIISCKALVDMNTFSYANLVTISGQKFLVTAIKNWKNQNELCDVQLVSVNDISKYLISDMALYPYAEFNLGLDSYVKMAAGDTLNIVLGNSDGITDDIDCVTSADIDVSLKHLFDDVSVVSITLNEPLVGVATVQVSCGEVFTRIRIFPKQ